MSTLADVQLFVYSLTALGIIVAGLRYLPRIIHLLDAIDSLTKAQLQENHGSSLVDKVNMIPGICDRLGSIESRVGDNTAQLTDLKEKMSGVDERTTRIDARTEGRFVAPTPPRRYPPK